MAKQHPIFTIGYEGASVAAPSISQRQGWATAICADWARRNRGAGARSGDHDSFERIFRRHLEEPEALLDLGEALSPAGVQPICLLCLERDPEQCHRLIVAERMS
jgi:uncharacterized protein YeaO (DUF488 family)